MVTVCKKLVPLAPVPKRVDRKINTLLKTLRQAGMATDEQIVEGLRTGAVSQAISWQIQYTYVIDYLVDKGYDVSSYRNRIVCGSNRLVA
jgi:hypothetical protein